MLAFLMLMEYTLEQTDIGVNGIQVTRDVYKRQKLSLLLLRHRLQSSSLNWKKELAMKL